MKTGIFGANGRMGRVLIEAVTQEPQAELSAAIVRSGSDWLGMDVGQLAGIGDQGLAVTDRPEQQADELDVMIDFTLPDALKTNLDWCLAHNKPVVIGTTGLNDEQKVLLERASEQIPIVFAANYSVGVNLLLNLLKQTARVMGQSCDIEIWEAHHRHKLDAPSGTAVAMGEAIADELGRDLGKDAVYGRKGHTGERPHQQIGFATIRAGDIVGEHTAMFADIGERIELTHKASSRLTFAKGALRAALWLKDKPAGLYSMQQVLGLE
ncbi:4-hydroxy-tetrahydrodipicolinate reductase [Lacimicrobium alkaliphilum]|uniref:4-hydroxy-tetrahydrodipicolinate reductase n=1 Tax=Lacimicrobium alkaliphilum TaxID=1526571 RepID=A0A0U3AHJ6_9ALTE|nr:4-hydroxy-tetrahydrodipicolinate reductase [Lacimicrobium alkaliphilum]ALS98177.1 4-hydroxy-tetrahydrodipicolinate reductase [Lacimicrobium alkaliphilum]